MVSSPFFSIIIPTYNRAELLRRALDSIAAQTFRDFEVIVCDDGSSDQTPLVVESFKEKIPLTYLWEKNWGGPARPRNRGIVAARGEWVCFLDSDDWWYSSKLKRIRQFSSDADVIYHDVSIFSRSGGKNNKTRGRRLRSPAFDDLMTGWNPFVTSATCIRKSIVHSVGGFNEDRHLIAVEDFDLWLRIARITERLVHVPEVLGAYEVGDHNISLFSEASLNREKLIFEQHVKFMPVNRQYLANRMINYRLGLIYWHIGLGKKSRESFLKSLFPVRWRHRLLVVPWIIASYFCRVAGKNNLG